MGKNPKKELIDDIRDFLLDFEESYDDKEWRKFQEYRQVKPKKTIPLYIKLAGIAVSLILVVYASVKISTFLNSTKQTEQSTPNEKQVKDSTAQDSTETKQIEYHQFGDSLIEQSLPLPPSDADKLMERKIEINKTLLQLKKQIAHLTSMGPADNDSEIKDALRNLENQIAAFTLENPRPKLANDLTNKGHGGIQLVGQAQENSRTINSTDEYRQQRVKDRKIIIERLSSSSLYYAPRKGSDLIFSTFPYVDGRSLTYDAIHLRKTMKDNFSTNISDKEKPKGRKPNSANSLQFHSFKKLFDQDISLRYLRPGISFNTGFTPKGLSMGAGVSVQIPLTDRISTEIGGSYAHIKGETDLKTDYDILTGPYGITRPQISGLIAVENIGIGVKHNLGIISLPISVNYQFSRSFSSSLTLKPFKVIGERRTDIAKENTWEPLPSSFGTSKRLLSSEIREIKQSSTDYKNNTYWGFIEASTSISPPFLNKYNTVIAPYLAIPVGKLNKDQYNWINGGLSLKFYFRKP